MGQLLGGASGGGWQPLTQSWAPPADLRETGEAHLAEAVMPGVARDDIRAGLAGQELVISGEYRDPASTAGRCAAGGARAGPGTGCWLPRQVNCDHLLVRHRHQAIAAWMLG